MSDTNGSAGPPGGMVAGGAQYPPGPPDRWPTWVPPLPGPTMSGGGADPGGSSERRRAGLVAVGAAVVLLVVVGIVAWATQDGGGDEVASASTSSTAPDTTEPFTIPQDPVLPSVPGLDPSDPGLDPSDPGLGPLAEARPLEEVLPELIDFVEVTRGHRFRTAPVVEAVDEATFLERFGAVVEGSEEELRDAGVAQRALGILEPDSDPVAIQDDLGEQGVLGFYDPETAELVVRGDRVTPYVETIIVHELTHALDDQYFDLERGEVLAQRPDESGFGFFSLTEGSARRVQVAYEEQMSIDDQISAQIEALTSGLGGLSDPTADPLPVPFAVATQLPYGNGAELVEAIVDNGGNQALDAAFRSPPTTSEQVLDPAQYLARDPAFAVPVPAADGPVVDQGAFGAVDLRLLDVTANPESVVSLLDRSAPVSTSLSVDPVEGLAGGSYVSWEEGGRSCIRFTVVGDSEAATVDLSSIVTEWEVSTGADPGQLRGTSRTSTRCA